jgi:hypothetical protein
MPIASLMLTLLSLAPLTPQQTSPSPATPAAEDHSALHDYESCTFDDGLQIVKIDAMPPGVQERTVDTASGPKTISMLDGRRILFAYGLGGDTFANVKPEILPSDTWAIEKQALLDQMNAMLASSHDQQPDTGLPHEMHGLEVRGFNRTILHGNTLGYYLLFDDARHIATTVYLLNQEPITRRFQTIEQFHQLGSRFLKTYSTCIAQNQSLHSPGSTQ